MTVCHLIVVLSFGQCTCYSESSYKQYFSENVKLLEPIEGIWSVSQTIELYYKGQLNASEDRQQGFNVAIKKNRDEFDVCYWGSGNEHGDDKGGYKTRRTLRKAANENLFFCEINFYDGYGYASGINETVKSTAVMNAAGILEIVYKVPKELTQGLLRKRVLLNNLFSNNSLNLNSFEIYFKELYIKSFPTKEFVEKNRSSQGSGFAISSDGLVATNFHVIENAKKIKLRGINGNLSRTYEARIVLVDKNNDLAILKIDDFSFDSLGAIPYNFNPSISDVGESIFVIGYPMTQSMGNESKLTTGVISAKSGFQGDITSYQISAAVQPGNSGCPLFDSKGNVIGIINAKHVLAENASYAVKSFYLINLIDLLPNPPKSLLKENILLDKPLTKQVELVQPFIYIIEIN